MSRASAGPLQPVSPVILAKPRSTVQFFASAAAMEEALLAHGADLTVPERLRELRRLNERLFAPLHAALRGRPVETRLFKRRAHESEDEFIRRVAHEKEQWTFSMRKAPS